MEARFQHIRSWESLQEEKQEYQKYLKKHSDKLAKYEEKMRKFEVRVALQERCVETFVDFTVGCAASSE